MGNEVDPGKLRPEHVHAIHALADEMHQPVADVGRLYAETLQRLETDARVKEYVPLFTVKSVRDALRNRRH